MISRKIKSFKGPIIATVIIVIFLAAISYVGYSYQTKMAYCRIGKPGMAKEVEIDGAKLKFYKVNFTILLAEVGVSELLIIILSSQTVKS